MEVIVKPIQDYAPRLYIQDGNLICGYKISAIIENYAEKLGLSTLDLELYTKCYDYLNKLDEEYDGIYFCEDKFHIDIIPFLDKLILEKAKI